MLCLDVDYLNVRFSSIPGNFFNCSLSSSDVILPSLSRSADSNKALNRACLSFLVRHRELSSKQEFNIVLISEGLRLPFP